MERQALITGANSNIGIALCKQYLASGCRVLAHYHNDNSKFQTLRKEAGAALVPIQKDFSAKDAVEEMIASDQEQILKSDIFVHLAAIREDIVFSDIDGEALMRHFTVNLFPAILFMRSLGPRMAERGWGRIVMGGSVGVKFGGGGSSYCYSISKHALEFMPAIHKKWAASNVFINTVQIGITDTKIYSEKDRHSLPERIALIPAKRSATPTEMARTIHWLGSAQNSFMTGQVVTAAGGE
ncbi:MAG: SDR family oxidoreductase [Magnetococcales bacterium]|nr:SDR family oxidoreductase [Magnetococcales bacterium]